MMIGAIATWLLRYAIASLVADLAAPNAWSLGATFVLMVVVTASAVALPAMRALRQDPSAALRLE
jgi:hypothetical protein